MNTLSDTDPHAASNGAVAITPEVRALPQFPDSVLRPRRSRWRHRVRTTIVLVILTGLVVGAALVARTVTADATAELRTATAARQSIVQRYRGVAVIEPVTRAALAFPVGGTVTGVEVTVGDVVDVGDTLAAIDTTQLEQALRQAESTLASAQLTLNVALAGEDPSSVGAGGNAGGAPIGFRLPSGSGTTESAASDVAAQFVETTPDAVTAARQAIVDAQASVGSAGNDVAARRDAATSICSAVDVTIDPNDPATSIGTIASSLGACQAALAELAAAQDALTAAQEALTTAVDAYDAALSEWDADLDDTTTTIPGSPTATSLPSGPPTSDPDASGADSSVPSTGQPSGGGGSFPSGGIGSATVAVEETEPTATELISYQAAFDAAAGDVEAARQALAQAELVTPVAGTVVSVGLAVGDSVSASSDTATVVVQGESGFEATLSVSVEEIDQIAVGQHAAFVVDGLDATVTGEVVGVSLVPESSSGSTSYRVTVGVTGDTEQLTSGNVGDVAIDIASADDVLAIPASALSPTGNGYTVDTVDATTGEVETVRVEIGTRGAEWVEITSGLDDGQTIVLAELGEPLPGAATDVSGDQGAGTFPGVFPGGGSFPGLE